MPSTEVPLKSEFGGEDITRIAELTNQLDRTQGQLMASKSDCQRLTIWAGLATVAAGILALLWLFNHSSSTFQTQHPIDTEIDQTADLLDLPVYPSVGRFQLAPDGHAMLDTVSGEYYTIIPDLPSLGWQRVGMSPIRTNPVVAIRRRRP